MSQIDRFFSPDSAWLWLPMWLELGLAIFCVILLLESLIAMPMMTKSIAKLNRHCESALLNRSVLTADVIANLRLSLLVERPLSVLATHRGHPSRWDLVDDTIADDAADFVRVSGFVIQSVVQVGLALTLIGIMSAIEAMEQDSNDLSRVMGGFRVAINSSIVGIGIMIAQSACHTIRLWVHEHCAKAIQQSLVAIEPLLHPPVCLEAPIPLSLDNHERPPHPHSETTQSPPDSRDRSAKMRSDTATRHDIRVDIPISSDAVPTPSADTIADSTSGGRGRDDEAPGGSRYKLSRHTDPDSSRWTDPSSATDVNDQAVCNLLSTIEEPQRHGNGSGRRRS